VSRAITKQSELLFDTSALVDTYRGQVNINAHFELILVGNLMREISVITEAELWRGLLADELEYYELLLSQFISLPLDSDVARLTGIWMQKCANTGLVGMDA
jgi:predicted nucleic acid-binding protein